jgi:hypothetical protein
LTLILTRKTINLLERNWNEIWNDQFTRASTTLLCDSGMCCW